MEEMKREFTRADSVRQWPGLGGWAGRWSESVGPEGPCSTAILRDIVTQEIQSSCTVLDFDSARPVWLQSRWNALDGVLGTSNVQRR